MTILDAPDPAVAPSGMPAGEVVPAHQAVRDVGSLAASATMVVPRSRTAGLAATAFVVGLVALLSVTLPAVALGSIAGGVVAVALGIVALRGVVPGGGGQGFAIAAILLGAFAVVDAPAPMLVREDLSDLDCATVAEQAAAYDIEEYDAEAVLVAFREPEVLEDQRSSYTLPRGAGVTVVYSCAGDAEWADGTTYPATAEVAIDSEGEIYVDLY